MVDCAPELLFLIFEGECGWFVR